MKGAWLAHLTWPEARDWIDAGRAIIIPVGAASKEHGQHLPLGTDWILAEGITRLVLETLPVLAAPILGHGYYPAFRHYPGSQHLSPQTFGAILDEVLEGFVTQGARRLIVLNTGISTEPVITLRLREFYERHRVRVLGANISQLGRDADVEMEQVLGGHGDEHETSILMHLVPDLVHPDRAVTDYGQQREMPKSTFYVPTVFDGDPASGWDYSQTGVRGDPTLATPEKGKAILSATAKDVIEGIRAHFPEALE